MIKKLFDWTPRDIAYWQRIHEKGLGYFIVRYGLAITGGLMFLIFGLIALIRWLWLMRGTDISTPGVIFLLGQISFVAVVCLVAGLVNSLITWVVEERLYRKYKEHG